MSKRIAFYAALLLVGMTTAASADPISSAIAVGVLGFTAGSTGAAIATAVIDFGLAIGGHVRGRVLGARK